MADSESTTSNGTSTSSSGTASLATSAPSSGTLSTGNHSSIAPSSNATNSGTSLPDTPPSASQCPSRKTEKISPDLWSSQHFVTLFAGTEDAEPFKIHRDFAICRSPVLKAAFESDFVEGQTQEYRFDQDFNNNVIQVLTLWFYTLKIDLDSIRTSCPDDPFGGQCRCLVRLWILAEQLLIPQLQNAAISTLDTLCDDEAPTFLCRYVHRRTSKGSPLREWFLVQHTFGLEAEAYSEDARYFPREMLIEIATLRALASRDPRLRFGNIERFKVPEE